VLADAILESRLNSDYIGMISIRRKKAGSVQPKSKAKTGFLNFSQKVDYGLFLLAQLANASTEKPVSLKEIANEQNLSFYFLQKVAADLRRDGYTLVKSPEETTMKEVLEAIEGPIALLACLNHNEHSVCLREDSCIIKKGLGSINREIIKTLENFTLFDFLNENERSK